MAENQLYGTFLVTEPGRTTSGLDSSAEVDWGVTYRDDPIKRHWATSNGDHLHLLTRSPDVGELQFHSEHDLPCQELVIEAHDKAMAENICSLVFGGILLAYPDAFELPEDASVYPIDELNDELLTSPGLSQRFTWQRNLALRVEAAKRAWNDTNLIYGIEKYRLSLHLDWFTPHSAAPHHGQIFNNEYPEYSYHTRAAYAIVVAYSVVEELGLEVRSSSRNPRFLGKDKDRWNPEVREDVLERLAAAGVDYEEPFIWLHRGEPTQVEQSMQPKLGSPATWAVGEVVRDRQMHLVDAIHQASYLRNFLTAHRFSRLVKAISPYDVHSAQLLARRLLLGALGLWGQL
jgi:hypothetical protein